MSTLDEKTLSALPSELRSRLSSVAEDAQQQVAVVAHASCSNQGRAESSAPGVVARDPKKGLAKREGAVSNKGSAQTLKRPRIVGTTCVALRRLGLFVSLQVLVIGGVV